MKPPLVKHTYVRQNSQAFKEIRPCYFGALKFLVKMNLLAVLLGDDVVD